MSSAKELYRFAQCMSSRQCRDEMLHIVIVRFTWPVLSPGQERTVFSAAADKARSPIVFVDVSILWRSLRSAKL